MLQYCSADPGGTFKRQFSGGGTSQKLRRRKLGLIGATKRPCWFFLIIVSVLYGLRVTGYNLGGNGLWDLEKSWVR